MKNNSNQKIEELIEKLQIELQKINTNKIFVIYNSIYKLIAIQFIKGIAFGLGSVLGATIVVSILLYFLAQIEFIPIIGDWVQHIVNEIEMKK